MRVALAIAATGCAGGLQGLVQQITHEPPPNESNAPPLPPPSQPAVWADTLYARRPADVGRLMGEIFTGGATKSCYYDCGRRIGVLDVPAGDACPASARIPRR